MTTRLTRNHNGPSRHRGVEVCEMAVGVVEVEEYSSRGRGHCRHSRRNLEPLSIRRLLPRLHQRELPLRKRNLLEQLVTSNHIVRLALSSLSLSRDRNLYPNPNRLPTSPSTRILHRRLHLPSRRRRSVHCGRLVRLQPCNQQGFRPYLRPRYWRRGLEGREVRSLRATSMGMD